ALLRRILAADDTRKDAAKALKKLPARSRHWRINKALATAKKALAVRDFSRIAEQCLQITYLQAGHREALDLQGRAEEMEQDHRLRLERCRELVRKGLFTKARDEYTSLRNDYPWDTTIANELKECADRLDEIEKVRKQAGKKAGAREQAGDLRAALAGWRKVSELDPNDRDAKNEYMRLKKRLRSIRMRRALFATGAALVVAFLSYAAWSGWDNQQSLTTSKELLSRGSFDAARAAWKNCGWFCAWGKRDLGEKLDRQEFAATVELARKHTANKQFAKAIKCYRGAAEIPGKSEQIADSIVAARRTWKTHIAKLLAAGKWRSARAEVLTAMELFPEDRKFPTFLNVLLDLGDDVKMELTLIGAGTFEMGSRKGAPSAETDEHPQHTITIRTPFYIGLREVTQSQYEKVMGRNPSKFKGPDRPVETVSWNDAVEFCKRLSTVARRKVRLPTEAEWEYACRADTRSTFSFGNDGTVLRLYANCGPDRSPQRNLAASKPGKPNGRTEPVGKRRPNNWGLYDMHGNVWEWCSDWYGDFYPPRGHTVDPQGLPLGVDHVRRGGAWSTGSRDARCANRDHAAPDFRDNDLGLRVVMETR
ncbi:MAG: formylglycine-generating enzyme family protein, partial [Planctomycetes bacterium]|nr:formylglycine-generating enzyme family protein [Planctomycetota bacterium]